MSMSMNIPLGAKMLFMTKDEEIRKVYDCHWEYYLQNGWRFVGDEETQRNAAKCVELYKLACEEQKDQPQPNWGALLLQRLREETKFREENPELWQQREQERLKERARVRLELDPKLGGFWVYKLKE